MGPNIATKTKWYIHKLFQKHTNKLKFYPSADDFTQALLVMLVTNFTSGHICHIWIKLAYLCLDQVLQQPIHWKNINNYFEVTLKKNQRRTWFIVVEHEEELDEPGQLNCLEHLSDEAQLAEVNHEPEGGYVQFQLNCCGFCLSRILLYFPLSVCRASVCHRRDISVFHLYNMS